MPQVVDGVALWYQYRDASNYKVHDQIQLAGDYTELHRQRIAAALDDDDGHFIPEQVNVRCLIEDLENRYEDDHPWHEIDPTLYYPAQVLTKTRTVEEFVCALEQAKADGWDPGICEAIVSSA